MIGEDIDNAYYAGGLSPTTQSKDELSPFENHGVFKPVG